MKIILQNCSTPGEFHLVAFSNYPHLQLVFFIGVFFMYFMCLLGNLIILILVCLASKLHTPMYFFLCNLSVLDIIYVSVISPKLMDIMITKDTSISNSQCFFQFFLYVFCVGSEFFLLTSMAYDRYVAICIPLHYILLMNTWICFLLALLSWNLGALKALVYILLISNLSISDSKKINHLFCHMMSVLKLSCTDSTHIKLLIMVNGITLGFICMILFFYSYIHIMSTILKIKTSSGRQRAFSRCSSHITIVLLFCLSSLILNMKAESEHSQEQDKLLSMIYISVVPMLNPLIYSLRNNDVIKALRNIIYSCCSI
ncbi:olfactory receptor 1G1-like [Bufo bufo]|uniref:olfactory receptor 1G1-like n=1 Tax=Bufo bufo TaxID=8384 RepID=UPI001ABDB32C|nr:olfactory receptor 1G1-like [Bufo bufo]